MGLNSLLIRWVLISAAGNGGLPKVLGGTKELPSTEAEEASEDVRSEDSAAVASVWEAYEMHTTTG